MKEKLIKNGIEYVRNGDVMKDIKLHACCFFGHRKIDVTEELKNKLCGIIENLIVNEKVDTFLFGSKSQFDNFCHEIVTDLKKISSHKKDICQVGVPAYSRLV